MDDHDGSAIVGAFWAIMFTLALCGLLWLAILR